MTRGLEGSVWGGVRGRRVGVSEYIVKVGLASTPKQGGVNTAGSNPLAEFCSPVFYPEPYLVPNRGAFELIN